MKLLHRLIVVALIMLAVSVVHATDMSANLQAFWSLDNVNDAHGSNTLTNNNTVTFVTGKVGNAGDFNGSTQYLSIADNAALSMGDIDFSVQLWFKVDSLTPSAQTLLVKGDSVSGNMEYGFFVINDGTVRWRIDTGLGGFPTVISGTTISTGVWYHVIGYHDATANEIGIVVNDDTPVTTTHLFGSQDTAQPLEIGRDQSGSRYFDGLVDQAAVWKRRLSGSEITELYNSGNGYTYAQTTGGGGAAAPCLRSLLGVGCEMHH